MNIVVNKYSNMENLDTIDRSNAISFYQVDTTLGSLLLTNRSFSRVLVRIYVHLFGLAKTLFRYKDMGPLNLNFHLIVKYYDIDKDKSLFVNFGEFHQWKSKFLDWFLLNNSGCNLYIEMFYILSFKNLQ